MLHPPMTTQDARRALARPPKFGDETQIAAIQFLEDIESARTLMVGCRHQPCRHCDGTGGRKNLCEDCEGTGTVRICNCFKGLSPWAVREARRKP